MEEQEVEERKTILVRIVILKAPPKMIQEVCNGCPHLITRNNKPLKKLLKKATSNNFLKYFRCELINKDLGVVTVDPASNKKKTYVCRDWDCKRKQPKCETERFMISLGLPDNEHMVLHRISCGEETCGKCRHRSYKHNCKIYKTKLTPIKGGGYLRCTNCLNSEIK